MKIVILDFEALFVPTTGPVPVTEIGCAIVEKCQVVQSFHMLVRPEKGPFTAEDQKNCEFVYQRVSGLSLGTLGVFGFSLTEAKKRFAGFLETHQEALFLARGPELEQRVLNDWGLGHIHVEEVLDYVVPCMRDILYFKRSRPQQVRWMACQHGCPHHDNGATHCAMADVMEEFLWLFYHGCQTGLERRTYEKEFPVLS